MNPKATRILLAVLWLASIAAAYFIGQSATAPRDPAASNTSNAKTDADAAAAENARRVGKVIAGLDPDAAGAPGEKKNVSNLIARARAEMAGGMSGMGNFRGMLRAIAPLAELDNAQIQEALAEVEKTVKEPQQKMMFYSLLLGQWAETDGPAAMAYAEEKLSNKSPFDFGVRSAILGSWARTNPDAVWRWYETERDKLSSDPNAQMVTNAVFAGMAAKDLDLALSRLNTVAEGQDRMMAVNGITSIAWDEHGRRRLLDRAESLPPEIRKPMQEAAVRNWAMSDPEGAIKWLRTRPEEDQPGLRQAAGQMAMMSDPQRGAELLMEGVPEKDKPRTYDTIIGQWAYRDARGAGEWLTKQPQGPELDNARRTFASIVVQRDPPAAMDWAKSVVNPEQRVASVQQIYTAWKQRDAAAADSALDASGLEPDKITELKQSTPATPTKVSERPVLRAF